MTDLALKRSGEVRVADLVNRLMTSLTDAGIEEPRRMANDIIASLMREERAWPILNRDAPLGAEVVDAASRAAGKIIDGAPFAYAVGVCAFRHLLLEVDERVLVPRPETEVFVDQILSRMSSSAETWGNAVDVGTGSGAIALSLATEGKFERIIATDSSLDAIAVATRNIERLRSRLHAPIELRAGSLLSPVQSERVRLVVSNPPYVAFSEIDALPPSVRDWEPPTALLTGGDGMAATAGIIRHSASVLESGGLLALEVDERRASLVAELAMASGNYIAVGVGLDLTGRERFVFASRI